MIFKSRRLRMLEFNATKKMEGLHWVIRNVEFISPKLIDDLLNNYLDILNNPKSLYYNAMVDEQHASDVISSIYDYLEENQQVTNPDIEK